MALDARPTTFVTEAAGFIGLELVKVLLARGHQVFGVAQCPEAALRVWRSPQRCRLVIGRMLADDLHADAVFANIRLRGIGFHFRYPTLEQELEQILGVLHE
jgi:nucleoside-diphosphate-sugar epimerase